MIDIKHKVLEAIKNNLGNESFFKDRVRLEELMSEEKSIDSWDRRDRYKMFQEITEEILRKHDINQVLSIFIEYEYIDFDSRDIDLFKAVVYEYYLFLKKIYEIYLLDQIYYLLNSDIDFFNYTCDFSKPFKTGSYYEESNFEISLFQLSFGDYEEDIEVRLYNLKSFYVDLINELLKDKKYLHKKAWLNDKLKSATIDSDSYYVMQLFLMLNSIPSISKGKKNTSKKSQENPMQLVLEKF